MLADDAAHVAPVRAGLAAEAGRVCAEADGQIIGIERLVSVEVGDGDLGGGREPEIDILALEQVFGEFGRLPVP